MCISNSILKEIYTNSSMTVHLHKESNKIKTRRGVRQGDSITGKLFMTALESRKPIFGRLAWETRGLKIDGEYMSHLRFADDILIYVNTPHELQQMLQEWADENENQGLKMNVQVEDKGDDGKRHTNMCQQHPDREDWKLRLPGTDTAPETKAKTRRFNEESRPDGLSTTHAYFQQWTTARKHGCSPLKQRTS